MKKYILLSVLFASVSLAAIAQDNAMEAKAAYLLAEESFEAGKYADCISYLDEAAKKLGTANSKILYLKIMSLQQLAEKDEKLLPELQKAIDAFQKADDIGAFNEEKQMEVAKLKLKVAKKISLIPTNRLETAAWLVMRVKGWKLGMTLDELTQSHPDFFSQAKHQPMEGNAYYYGTYNGVTLSLILQHDKLKEAHMVVEYMSDNKSFDKGKTAWATVHGSLLASFGNSTTDTTTTSPAKESAEAFVRTASWVIDDRQLALVHTGNSLAKVHTSIIQLKISLL